MLGTPQSSSQRTEISVPVQLTSELIHSRVDPFEDEAFAVVVHHADVPTVAHPLVENEQIRGTMSNVSKEVEASLSPVANVRIKSMSAWALDTDNRRVAIMKSAHFDNLGMTIRDNRLFGAILGAGTAMLAARAANSSKERKDRTASTVAAVVLGVIALAGIPKNTRGNLERSANTIDQIQDISESVGAIRLLDKMLDSAGDEA